jgi:hypothetical protein
MPEKHHRNCNLCQAIRGRFSLITKSSILFCLSVIFSLSVTAQENCPKIQPTAEILLNLQLGMSVDEVGNKLGKGLKIKNKSDGDYRFFQNYIGKKPPHNLSEVQAIYLRFFEKKLYQIEIFYTENKIPSDLRNFAEIVSKQLNLPVADWKFAHRQAVFKCGGNSLKIDYQLNPRIELTDEIRLKKVTEQYKSIKDN